MTYNPPVEFTKSDVERLRHDIRLLDADHKLILNDFQITWAIDYSELFRYQHAVIDYLQTSERKTYFSRQFAVHALLNWEDCDRILLEESLLEYKKHIKHIEKSIIGIVGSKSLDQYINSFKNQEVDPLHDLLEGAAKLDIPGWSLDRNNIKTHIIGAIKAEIIRQEYAYGVRCFQKLLRMGSIRLLENWEEKSLPTYADYDHNYKEIIGHIRKKYRPESERTISSETDAKCITKLRILNQHYYKNHRLYLMITDAEYSRDSALCLNLDEPLGDIQEYSDTLPLLRSLNYCLLSNYFIAEYNDFEARANAIHEFRRFVEEAYAILYVNIKTRRDPFIRRALKKQIESLLDSLFDLHDYDGYFELIKNRVFEVLKISNESASLSLSPEILSSSNLGNLVKDTNSIYERYKNLNDDIKEIRLKLRTAIDKSATKITLSPPVKGNPIYGVYPEHFYMPVDNEIKIELNEIFERLADPRSTIISTRPILDKIEDLLKANEHSPALRIAHSICLRHLEQFSAAETSLSVADKLFPYNIESRFQRAILFRVRADSETTSSISKVQLIQNALDLALQTIEQGDQEEILIDDNRIKKKRPRYFQFAAYIIWRFLLLRNPNLENAPNEDDIPLIEMAKEYCQRGLDEFDFSNHRTTQRIYHTLLKDSAYYYALNPDKDGIKKGIENIHKVPQKELKSSGWDSYGFIHLQSFKINPRSRRIRFVKISIACYNEAIRLGSNYKGTFDRLNEAIKILYKYGGNMSDLNLEEYLPKKHDRDN